MTGSFKAMAASLEAMTVSLEPWNGSLRGMNGLLSVNPPIFTLIMLVLSIRRALYLPDPRYQRGKLRPKSAGGFVFSPFRGRVRASLRESMVTPMRGYGYPYARVWLSLCGGMVISLRGYGYPYAGVWLSPCGGMVIPLRGYGYPTARVWLSLCGGMVISLWGYGYPYARIWLSLCEGMVIYRGEAIGYTTGVWASPLVYPFYPRQRPSRGG